jgi:hypothetical protein
MRKNFVATIVMLVMLFVSVTSFAFERSDPRYGRKGPFILGVNKFGHVALMDKQGITLKHYTAADNKNNLHIYPTGDVFYVLRQTGKRSYMATIYSIANGQNLRMYPVSEQDIRTGRWVR